MKKFIITIMLMLTIYIIESKLLHHITLHRFCVDGYEYVVAEKSSANSSPAVIQSYESLTETIFVPKECKEKVNGN